MPKHDLIVLGASAGGVEALREVVSTLPATLPATVLIVQHLAPARTSRLPAMLTFQGGMPARWATDGATLALGHIYIAPPDRHLLVHHGWLSVVRGPREGQFRPAIDPLFRSAARHYGRRVSGVILSGELAHGTAGLSLVSLYGGETMVQLEAPYPSMPSSALLQVPTAAVLSLSAIGRALVRLAHTPIGARPGNAHSPVEEDFELADVNMEGLLQHPEQGLLSIFTCPECRGPLWERVSETLLQYRGHVGHELAANARFTAQAARLEAKVHEALRLLAMQATRAELGEARATVDANGSLMQRYHSQILEARGDARILNDLLREAGPLFSHCRVE